MKHTRRRFLAQVSQSALAASLASIPWANSVFAATGTKKVIFVYTPDGCIPTRFHPNTVGTNFTLPDQTSELEAVKQHCVFPRGLTMYEGGSSHEGGARKVLTGNNDQSLDYFLGQQLGAATPFKSIHLGVASNFQAGGNKQVSYQSGGVPISANDDPLNAFANIFGSADSSEKTRALSIIDVVNTDLNRLKNALGNSEKAKLDEHTQALFEVEQRIKNASSGACDTGGFNPQGFSVPTPDTGWPRVIHLEQHFEVVGQLQMDIITRALACGMTRVASLSFSHAVSPVHVEGLATGNHDASHYGQNTSQAANVFSQYKRYFVRQFKYLIDALNAKIDTDGNTLLHNTLILFCSELGDSNRHDHKDMPFILAGNACGDLVTGRSLNFDGDAHSKLLVSIANLMGVPISSFGYTGHGTGGLTGL